MNDITFGNGIRFNGVYLADTIYSTKNYSLFVVDSPLSRNYKRTLASIRRFGAKGKVVDVCLDNNSLLVDKNDVDLFVSLVELNETVYFRIISDVSIKIDIRELEKIDRF